MSNIPTGRFAWYELMTTDPDAAPGFYSNFTPWTAMPWDGGPEPYSMWMIGEQPIGGIMKLPQEAIDQGAPPNWMVHISTPDIDATVAKAQELGGMVMHRETVPTVGSFAIIADPHGAVFSAYQPEGDAPGHDGPAKIGEFSWHELMSNDWKEAWAFYSELFGWTEDSQMDMGEIGIYHMFKGPAHPIGGMLTRTAEMGPAAFWLFYIHVESVGTAAEAVTANGGKVINGPMEIPGGDTIAVCCDPQGATFALHGKA